jgi:hypothetical protein
LVPVFAARWRSIRKYFNSSENKRSEKEKKYNIQQRYKENATRLYSEIEPKEQSSQSHYNSHFNLNKQAFTQHEAALQKEQSDAPCNFMKLIIPI